MNFVIGPLREIYFKEIAQVKGSFKELEDVSSDKNKTKLFQPLSPLKNLSYANFAVVMY